jgi:uncharacterized protein YkwD
VRRGAGAAARIALFATAVAASAGAADAPLAWSAATRSPRPIAAGGRDAPMYAACGTPDAALAEVATRAAARQLAGGGLPAADETAFAHHAAGDPHPWPRAFGIAGHGLDDATALAKLAPWAKGATTLGARRCGVGRAASADGAQAALAAIVVDALGDLAAPLPTQARVGQWLTVDANVLVPASDAKVVLLGPRGAPRTVLASLSRGRVRSTFSVDQQGPWLVQVLATVATGPRPIVDAVVYAGVAPPERWRESPAPGEDAAHGARDDADAVLRMINAARASEQLAPVQRDAGLDRVARAHAEAMRAARLVGHDVGDGDVSSRVSAAGLSSGRVLGENVANAQALERAHRALWASPSHRANLLLSRYRAVGVGVARDGEGVAWVAEVFRD